MFHFPPFASRAMNSRRDDTGLPVPGFPIRKSPDQSLLSGSPKLIAASHVLHRLLAPRHPPYALSSLTTYAQSYHVLALAGYPYIAIQLSKSSDACYGSIHFSELDLTCPRNLVELLGSQLHAEMELIGIEPTTSGLQSRRSPS